MKKNFAEDAAACRQLAVMRYEYEGCVLGVVQFHKHIEDVLAVLAVKVAGGLVGQDERRLSDEGAGKGHALLLAARKLHGIVVDAIRQPDAVE